MKRQKRFGLLALLLAVLLLCGCSQYDDEYDDEAFLTDTMNHYATIMWNSNIQSDGSLTLSASSFTGVRTLGGFTVAEDETLCEVTSTLRSTRGEAKLLILNTKEKTLAAQWQLGSQDAMTVTLPAGSYDLRIAGKSAGFKGQVELSLNGQAVSWDTVLDTVRKKIETAVTAKPQDFVQSLHRTLRKGQISALRSALPKYKKIFTVM